MQLILIYFRNSHSRGPWRAPVGHKSRPCCRGLQSGTKEGWEDSFLGETSHCDVFWSTDAVLEVESWPQWVCAFVTYITPPPPHLTGFTVAVNAFVGNDCIMQSDNVFVWAASLWTYQDGWTTSVFCCLSKRRMPMFNMSHLLKWH